MKKFIPPRWHYYLSLLVHRFTGYKKHAQFGEDALLLELFKDRSEGFYVDVGAHHPERYSNTHLLYKKGWRGVNIDPNPETIKLFKSARSRDINIESGIALHEGEMTYYMFSDPALNTFVEEEARRWMSKDWVTYLGTKKVKVRPLGQILKNLHIPSIDLLTIDTEGMDKEVLESYDWRNIPRVIVVEGEEPREFLERKGYTLRARLGVSEIFVKS